MSNKRIEELANRLISSGPKCCNVSASETHEISEYILGNDAVEQYKAELLEFNTKYIADLKKYGIPDEYTAGAVIAAEAIKQHIEKGE